jgi:hypothetical protein
MPHDIIPRVAIPSPLRDAHEQVATLVRRRTLCAEEILDLERFAILLVGHARALATHLHAESRPR